MRYRFLQDFKIGVGDSFQPQCIQAPCPAIYNEYQTIFKKGDIAEGRNLTLQEMGYDAYNPFLEPSYNVNLRFVKNGVNYDVPANLVTNVTEEDAKTKAARISKYYFLAGFGLVSVVVFSIYLFLKK